MLKNMSLSIKMMGLVIITTIVSSLVLGTFNTQYLGNIYEKRILAEMEQQALIERLQFDKQFKAFSKVAEYAAIYPPLILQMTRVKHSPEEIKTRKQRWFLKRSMVPADSYPQVVLLFDKSWHVKSGFFSHIKHVPELLQAPSFYLQSNVLKQSMITSLDDMPWVLSASPVKTAMGEILGYVLVASPIDSRFLNTIYRYNTSPNMIILGSSDGTFKVLASSDASKIASGEKLSSILDTYIVAGKDFFDYGASDLSLTFLSLRSRAELAEKVTDVMASVTIQSYAQAAILFLLFSILVILFNYRIQRLSRGIQAFTLKELDASFNQTSADALLQLEGHIAFLETTIVDVREKERLTAVALENKHQRLEEFFDDAIELIQSVGPDGRLKYVNQGWLKAMGYSEEEALSLHMQDFIHADCVEQCNALFQRLQEGESFAQADAVFVTKSGQKIDVQGSVRSHSVNDGIVIETYAIFHDVTEQKKKQEEEKQSIIQMEHAQRLESLGVLAGGIAHDFNNILTAIMGNAALIARSVEKDWSSKKQLQRIEEGSLRAAGLCQQMLAYSGKGNFIIQPCNISCLIQDTVDLMEVSVNKKTTIKLYLYDDLPSIEGDVSQLQQVFLNLITNANEAIGGENGVISISTGVLDVGDDNNDTVVMDSKLKQGAYVYLEVSDTGYGMDDDTKNKVFEPFFTTKFTGRGLGMSAVLGIIRAHHGAIEVHTKLGVGSSFRVLFPSLEKYEACARPIDEDLVPDVTGTVLVVDDEEIIRELATVMLEDLGFSVLLANDGEEAVQVYTANVEKICCVLLDMTMPKMDGRECFEKLIEMNPSIKVIMSSGYSEAEVTRGMQGLSGFLKKPYDFKGLEKAILSIEHKEE